MGFRDFSQQLQHIFALMKSWTVQKDEPDVPEPLRSNIIDAPSRWLKDEKCIFSA
jgi:hypothetical protein